MPTPDATRDPESMTEPERRAEVARILARGLVRRVREVRARASQSAGISPDPAATDLDLQAELRLSVAARPRG